MSKLNLSERSRVLEYFEEICSIPHGSGNTEKIADYCVDFAKSHNLKFYRDEANNVIIYKNGTKGYENSAPIILQGHLDMVCQKTPESKINFETDGLDIYVDGDFIRARGTTLGADDGMGMSIMFAILEDNEISHPPIEAVFTSDEEIGMIGAGKLDMSKLTAKRMINLDAGNIDLACVSCAGGVEVKITMPVERNVACGKKISFVISGLKGGHSGGKIGEGRVNADILAGRIISYAKRIADVDLLEINGGNKGNVIPSYCEFSVVLDKSDEFVLKMEEYIEEIKEELKDREETLDISVSSQEEGNFNVLTKEKRDKIIYLLNSLPNGVIDMDAKMKTQVETSLNFGILRTDENEISMLFMLRSNKEKSLSNLQEKMFYLAEYNGCSAEASGYYPPWEYIENSELQQLYMNSYEEMYKEKASVYVTHAGLECGMFSSKIKDLDCIAIGAALFDVHTVDERLSISSTKEFFEFLKYLLSNCR